MAERIRLAHRSNPTQAFDPLEGETRKGFERAKFICQFDLDYCCSLMVIIVFWINRTPGGIYL